MTKIKHHLQDEIIAPGPVEAWFQENESHFYSVFKRQFQFMAILSPTGRILEIRDLTLGVTQASREDYIGKFFWQSPAWKSLPEWQEIVQTQITQAISMDRPLLTEDIFQTNDGTIRKAEVVYTVIRDSNNKVRFILVQASDITEQKEAGLALEEYAEQLEEIVEIRTNDLKEAQRQVLHRMKLAAMGQLAGSVAHKLRNPLSVIFNSVYYLQTVISGTDNAVSEYLGIIRSQIQEVEQIIEDLLGLSQVRPALRHESAVAQMVTEVLLRHSPPEGVSITTEIPVDIPAVFVDAQQIRQALVNLVTNAYQTMPDGGNLTLIAKQKQSHVYLSIADTGGGISSDRLSKIFEPLFSIKTHGWGMGVAISKNLVEINGGHIDVESTAGQGSRFILTLPIKRDES